MWSENAVVTEDLERVSTDRGIPWERLNDATVLVTGATGLIGSSMVKALLWYGMTRHSGVRVLALVRDVVKAELMFAAPLAAGAPLSFLEGDVETFAMPDHALHFVVHGASVTASRDFVGRPVETIRTALRGTERVLEVSREKQVRSLAYLSSMEVYGAPDGSRRITEATFDGLDPMQVRSSYPESKRMAEALCAAYALEYGVPAKVVRLAQTLGPGFALDDVRAPAQFARSALDGRDIVLHTTGESEQSYIYTADAVTAILAILLSGQDGEAYNVANEATYCSVRQMADLVARAIGPAPVAVRVEPQAGGPSPYAPARKVDLDTAKLRELGWNPAVGLEEMYRRMTVGR